MWMLQSSDDTGVTWDKGPSFGTEGQAKTFLSKAQPRLIAYVMPPCLKTLRFRIVELGPTVAGRSTPAPAVFRLPFSSPRPG